MRVPVFAAFLTVAGCVAEVPPRTVTYACDRGPGITVTFHGDTASIADPDGPIVLTQQPSASGVWYANASHELRGKGNEMLYVIGKMVPMQCRAQG